MRHYYSAMLLLLVALTAAGQTNRIYIEDFELAPDSTTTVPVMLANEDETRGIQFNFTMPPEMKFADYELTEYAAQEDFNMNLSVNKANDSTWTVMVYPSGRICFPPGEQAIVLLKFKAKPAFKGGDMLVWKCRGSTIDNMTIFMDDAITRVTVPQSSLIALPEDRFAVSEEFYSIKGQPIAWPGASPVAIRVTTLSDGSRTASKIASCR